MFGPVFHKFRASSSANRDKVFPFNLLLKVVLWDDSEKFALNLLEWVIIDEHVVVMEIELVLVRSNTPGGVFFCG